MNKNCFLYVIIFSVILFGTSCQAKQWYVSSLGNDENKGTSEQKPFKTLAKAISTAALNKNNCTITVIGALSAESEGGNEKAVFIINGTGENTVTITGKANAKEEQQAVLLGTEHGDIPVVFIDENSKIRFENIKITGAAESNGVIVSGGSGVTLGKGVKIADNFGTGIIVEEESTLVMEDGEISGNNARGVVIEEGCTFNMTGGSINNNTLSGRYGGGVYVGGIFTMEGGQISENIAEKGGIGGGIFVSMDAVFILKNGKIINNKASGLQRNNVGSGGGGGVLVGGSSSGKTQFIMEGGEISGNTAERYGGGVLLISNHGGKGTFTMTGGIISGNTAKGGGGVQNYGNRFIVSQYGGEIINNTPDDYDEGWNW